MSSIRAKPESELSAFLYAVLDTNILMHFQYVNQIDWPAVLGAKEVCLVCTPILFRELDDLKDRSTRPGRGDLARRVSKTLQEPLEDAPFNQAVPLPQCSNTYVMSWQEDDLSIDANLRPEKQDDALIAAALHFKERDVTANVVLVSDDFNCRQRAKRFGITVQTLPEEFKRPLPLSEEEQRLKKLEALEPHVEIDVEGQLETVVLPQSERSKNVLDLFNSYKVECERIIRFLEDDLAYYLGEEGGPFERPENFLSANGLPFRYSAVRLLKEEFDLSVREELLDPAQKRRPLTYIERNQPVSQVETPYMARYRIWREHVETLSAILNQSSKDLRVAREDSQFYEIRITLRHIGGVGIQDGLLTAVIKPPFRLVAGTPSQPRSSRHDRSSGWQNVLDAPGSFVTSPFTKRFEIGNFHPDQLIECNPIYIHVDAHFDEKRDELSVPFTATLSALNVRSPIEKTVEIRLG